MATQRSFPRNEAALRDLNVEDLKTLIDDARTGRNAALPEVPGLISGHIKSPEKGALLMDLGLLEMLFGHLRSTLMPLKLLEPGCEENAYTYPSWGNSILALASLASLATSGSRGWRPNRRDVQRVHKSWSDVFAWSNLIFLCTKLLRMDENGSQTLLLLAAAWSSLSALDPDFHQVIIGTPGALPLVARYWIFLSNPLPYPSSDIREARKRSVQFMISTLSEVEGSQRASLLRKALDLDSNDALSDLIANQMSSDVEEANRVVRLLMALTIGSDKPFLLALQRSKVLLKLIQLLSSLFTEEMLGPAGTFFALCNNVFQIMRCGNGITGTYKAIRLGFFEAYLACSEELFCVFLKMNKEYCDNIASLADQIKNLVVTQMWNPHIFQATIEAFADIFETPVLLRSHKKLLRGSDFISKVWINLYDAFYSLQKVVQEDQIFFTSEGNEKKCFNFQCNHRSSASTLQCNLKLKTCARCHSAFYCSRGCQRIDYNIHRYFCYCPALESGRKLLRPVSLLNTKLFISNLTACYIVNHYKEEFVRWYSMNSAKDIDRDIVVRILMQFQGPLAIQSEIHRWQGSELGGLYPPIFSNERRRNSWMVYPHIMKSTGMSEAELDEDVRVHLDITVHHRRNEPSFRIHAICPLLMIIS